MKTIQGNISDSRALTDTEQQILNYLGEGCERQAVEFAKHITLPRTASHELIEGSIMMLLCAVKEAADGAVKVEYVCGIRRDTLRLQ